MTPQPCPEQVLHDAHEWFLHGIMRRDCPGLTLALCGRHTNHPAHPHGDQQQLWCAGHSLRVVRQLAQSRALTALAAECGAHYRLLYAEERYARTVPQAQARAKARLATQRRGLYRILYLRELEALGGPDAR